MRMRFPPAVPEIPVTTLDQVVDYHVDILGFTHDWGRDTGGLAGISRGDCRLFLASPSFREQHENQSPVLIWLNLSSKAEVDELYAQWASTGAILLSPPEDKPWLLREFTAADPDGNLLRVFYDFRRG